MKLYGIKSCGSVKKAVGFLQERGIAYDFVDLKQTKIPKDELLKWSKICGIEPLFNTKGTTYKKLALKDLALDENGKLEWLARENMLLKRPVIVLDNGEIVVGFDATKYESIFR